MTLDDLRVLRAAVNDYRAAATAAGLAWPVAVAEPPVSRPPDLVHRLFGLDHVAEQLTWFQSQGWHSGRPLPDGGWVLDWPKDSAEALDPLAFSIGTPFPWRHQMPLFHFEFLIYTFVLAGEHEGEIWRYEIAPDSWDTVRAATSLAALFTEWTNGIADSAIRYNDFNGWLAVDDNAPYSPAFPVSLAGDPLLSERQRACGVDLACIERGFDSHEELLDTIAATRARLGM
ncbi:hypothetical protein [Streptomyces sp. MK5]|uniref:hypothetical protein n=1 Tax=Streptomyces sp. MK5 TaxID=3064253 RepID=UPI0027412F26|nr:hypothetical protein [Streptomyces sp. MK5]